MTISIDPRVTRYRTLWISDVHLGMKASRAACLADFLEHNTADTIYLLGDIVDGLRLKKKWNWTPDCDRVVRLILDQAHNGTRIVYVPGNHDAFLRGYVGETICGVRVEESIDHVTSDGRLLHLRHGDDFDEKIRVAPWEAVIGHSLYHLATLLNIWLFALRRKLGLGYWSLARFLKSKSRKAEQYVRAYEEEMLSLARERKVEGIVTGHIHQPGIREQGGITYYNCGDWVDHCTLLAEHRNGSIELLCWDEARISGTPSQFPSPVCQQSL